MSEKASQPPVPMSWAMGGFGIALVLSLVVGEVPPFSRYTMYAGVTERTQAAVPVFSVEGKVSDIRDYARFADLRPETYAAPPGIPTSMEHVLGDMNRWIGEHDVTENAPSGGLSVSLGFVVATVRDGEFTSTTMVMQEGRAWPVE